MKVRILSKLKQRFCKHEMQKSDTYEIQTVIDSRIISVKLCEDYMCSKCGKKETIVVPQFIPKFKSIYNEARCNR